MSARIVLGLTIGAIVSLLSWRGNRTPHTVSVFPDWLSFLVLLGLMVGAVWFLARRTRVHDFVSTWRVGGTIAVTAGFVLGTAVVLIGLAQLGQPAPRLLLSGFLTAFGAALACGAAASALVSRLSGGHDGRTAA